MIKIEAPKWLSDREKEIFKEIPVNNKSDISAAATLASSLYLVEQMHESINACGFHPGNLSVLIDAMNVVKDLAPQFGMTPKSREIKG